MGRTLFRYSEERALKNFSSSGVSIGSEGFTSEIVSGKHLLIADEPIDFGGNDFGPSPYDYLASGLGACTAMTLRMYATRKKWDLQKVIVHVDHGKDHAPDSENVFSEGKKIDTFKREIEIFGTLDDKQRLRLLEIADKCPVHKTLSKGALIMTELI